MEGILLNAKSTNGGAATATLVQQAIRAKKIFVFGELLALPQVQSLKNSPDTASTYALLEIFAFGTFADYARQAQALGGDVLGEAQVFKLRQLTVVSLASKNRSLSYQDVIRETQLRTTREVEDLLIACVYDGLIKARLDQRNQRCLIQWSASRDVRPETLDAMLAKLSSWCASADNVLERIDRSMEAANKQRQLEHSERKLVQEEAENVKYQVMRESESHLGGEPSAKMSRTGGSGPSSASAKMVASVSQMLRRG